MKKPIGHGNGVFYFPGRRHFGESLSEFLEKNPHLEVIAMTGDGSIYVDEGFYVVFKEKNRKDS